MSGSTLPYSHSSRGGVPHNGSAAAFIPQSHIVLIAKDIKTNAALGLSAPYVRARRGSFVAHEQNSALPLPSFF